jgi:dTDP-4-dehydrorhamnose reductase
MIQNNFSKSPIPVLILGATGMMGNTLFRFLDQNPNYEVYGAIRSSKDRQFFSESQNKKISTDLDISGTRMINKLLSSIKPKVLVNCIGLVKQLAEVDDPLQVIPINSLLPHQLAKLCLSHSCRLIHLSTDCVFSGSRGNYVETDFADANDLYGRTKFLGEVDYPNAITLRTSIIGHELKSNKSLLNWFLQEKEEVQGFTDAIFSGLPTVELSRVIQEFVIPNEALRGTYHISSDPIDKFSLLNLIKIIYRKEISIVPSDKLKINRALDSSRFRIATGYSPSSWDKLIQDMKNFG